MARITDGGFDSRIMAVGEASGAEELAAHPQRCFIGQAGQELDRMFGDAGISRREVLLTNLSDLRPPKNDIDEFFYPPGEGRKLGIVPRDGLYPHEHLTQSIEELEDIIRPVQPNLIIALGDKPMWALTGERGITLKRGSE